MEQQNKKNTIMIVDDDNFMVDMYSIKFKEHNFDIHAKIDPKEALDELRDGFSPDIILFDMIMPSIGGIEFLKTIKKEKLAEIAILIALSNQREESDIKEALEMGADDYIIKANTIPSEVLSKIEDVLNKHKTQHS